MHLPCQRYATRCIIHESTLGNHIVFNQIYGLQPVLSMKDRGKTEPTPTAESEVWPPSPSQRDVRRPQLDCPKDSTSVAAWGPSLNQFVRDSFEKCTAFGVIFTNGRLRNHALAVSTTSPSQPPRQPPTKQRLFHLLLSSYSLSESAGRNRGMILNSCRA